MATHSSVLAWRIPGTGEPGGLPSMGSHRVGHDWSDLAAAEAVAKQWSPDWKSPCLITEPVCPHSIILTPFPQPEAIWPVGIGDPGSSGGCTEALKRWVGSRTHPLSLEEPSSSPSEQQPQKVVHGCVGVGGLKRPVTAGLRSQVEEESMEETQVNCQSLFFCF